MPHAQLVEHSMQMAKAVGEAMAHIVLAEQAGAKGPMAAHLRNARAVMDRASSRSIAMGEIAHGLSDEAPAADAPKDAVSGPVSGRGARAAG